MLVICQKCNAKVNGVYRHDYEIGDQETNIDDRYTLLSCPQCGSPIVMSQSNHSFPSDWSAPERLYPPTEEIHLSGSIPVSIAKPFNEATQCYRGSSYTATALLCRKSLEGICHDHNVADGTLAAMIKALKENGFISDDLFEWAELLRLTGNDAAHGFDIEIDLEDAKDTLEFTKALLEYVYTYRDRYSRFKARHEERKTRKKTSGDQSEEVSSEDDEMPF